MRLALTTLFFLGSALGVAHAQSVQRPVFEVASIKPIEQLPPGATGFGSLTQYPGMISITSVNLRSLLRRAYDLKEFQISGPDWIAAQCYDLNAKLPSGATPDQVPAMLQQLITERFGMELGWDTKPETGYVLVVDKSGPKLTPSADQGTHAADRPDRPRSLSMSDAVRMQGAPIIALANFLSGVLKEPVVDSTGLQGRYDITLSISSTQLMAAGNVPALASDDGGYTPGTLFDAVGAVGLRLRAQKVEVKHLTVVKADRIPKEN